jgi:hypothetical protein
MEKAAILLPLHSWPPEGRALGEILQQLISPSSWSVMTELTGERLSPSLKSIAKLSRVRLLDLDTSVEQDDQSDRQLVKAINECQPLLAHWISGALIAKGRRSDLFSSAVEIRPPTDWEVWVVDFSRSIIEDPNGGGEEIY